MTQIEVIKPEDRATQQLAQFDLDVANYQKQINAIVVTSIQDTQQMQEAGTLRKEIQKIRTSAEKVKKALKEDALAYNKAVDSVWNKIKTSAQDLEEQLKQKEKFAEIQEEKRILQITNERTNQLLPYQIDPELPEIPENLATLSPPDFNDLLAGRKLRHEEHEKQLVEAQLQKQADAQERETLRKENEALKQEVIKAKSTPVTEPTLQKDEVEEQFGIRFYTDGNKICAVNPDDYQNPQISPTGFGDTRLEAVSNLVLSYARTYSK
jgi:hypothetical protein